MIINQKKFLGRFCVVDIKCQSPIHIDLPFAPDFQNYTEIKLRKKISWHRWYVLTTVTMCQKLLELKRSYKQFIFDAVDLFFSLSTHHYTYTSFRIIIFTFYLIFVSYEFWNVDVLMIQIFLVQVSIENEEKEEWNY